MQLIGWVIILTILIKIKYVEQFKSSIVKILLKNTWDFIKKF